MSQIHVLDQNTIDKIAAGEVVERPASVVKELTENAIDAGATHITVEIRDGGITMIRVTDDGKGIAPEEIRLAFLRHATSKIESVEDLVEIGSLGFRGEALSSIAAVSRVELITKQPEELTAVRYVLEGGREKIYEEIGAPDGTTIIVRDIFYNTPARAKFLKTAMTEASHVGGYVEQLALSNPGIAFDFIVNGTSRITTTGNGKVRDTIYHIYGRELASEILPVDYAQEGIKITGFIAKPSVSRGNRNFENYYVNGRYVKSRVISLGIEDGYGNKLMQHQYPFTCLTVTVDGKFVDVNVHPTKMDVRFSDERLIMRAVSDCIRKTLYDQEMIIRQSLNPPEKPAVKQEKPVKYKNPEPFERQTIMRQANKQEMIREKSAPYGSSAPASSGQMPVTYDIGGAVRPEAGRSASSDSGPFHRIPADQLHWIQGQFHRIREEQFHRIQTSLSHQTHTEHLICKIQRQHGALQAPMPGDFPLTSNRTNRQTSLQHRKSHPMQKIVTDRRRMKNSTSSRRSPAFSTSRRSRITGSSAAPSGHTGSLSMATGSL